MVSLFDVFFFIGRKIEFEVIKKWNFENSWVKNILDGIVIKNLEISKYYMGLVYNKRYIYDFIDNCVV